jgi:hypothetical protein
VTHGTTATRDSTFLERSRHVDMLTVTGRFGYRIHALDQFTVHYHRERNHQGSATANRVSVLPRGWRPRLLR